MFTGLELMACPGLAVPAQVMQHVVEVESHGNPYAIGVVGARLQRQPRSLGEALATVRMLDAGGYDYSLGLAQVHRANLQPYGLGSYRQAFAPCANVAAGAHILAGCYASVGRHWGKAFSCYYSGDPVTGYRDGYVQKIHAAMQAGIGITPAPAIRKPVPAPPSASSRHPTPGDRAWRLAIRSAPIDRESVEAHLAGRPASAGDGSHEPEPTPAPDTLDEERNIAPGDSQASAANPDVRPAATDVFVPQVRGPRDPAPATANRGLPPAAPARAGASLPGSQGGHRDAAFVF